MKYFLSLALILFFSIAEIKAQPYSACFTSDKTVGCAPLLINLIDCSGVPASEPQALYRIQGPGTNITDVQSTFTLSNPGLYTITQWVSKGIGTGTDSLKRTDYIEVLPTPEPDFNVFMCIGAAVSVHISDAVYDKYYIDFGDGSAVVNALPNDQITHVYTDIMDKVITVTGHYDPINCGNQKSVTIRPFMNLPLPTLESIVVSNNSSISGEIELMFTTNNRFKYKVLQNTATGTVELDSVIYESGLQSLTLSAQNTESDSQCFTIQSYDDCGNTVVSEELCSIAFSVIPSDKTMNLSWTTDSNFDSFTITKNGELIETASSGTISFTDNDITCGANYCYQVNGIKGAMNSTSFEICREGQSSQKPNTLSHINSSYNSGKIDLSWEQVPDIEYYTVYQSNEPMDIEIITTSLPGHSVAESLPSEAMCFRVSVTDKCGNISPVSALTCPANLTLTRDAGENSLSWSPYSGTANSISYWVEKLDKNQNIIESIPVGGEIVFSDPIDPGNPVYFYRIKVVGEDSFVSYSNIVQLSNSMILIIPNAFSPNGDGVNDEFKPEGKFILNYRLTIINNWGNVVFTTTDPEEGWDGTFNGRPMVSGAYAYLVEATDYEGNKEPRSGTVTLIR